tara:strand:- start:445 stop:1257 length:813 start_codon:yes stop_codon:yes gene_type:complete
MKHNKKRNTAFIYETLTRELTKAIVDSKPVHKEKIVALIKEHFSAGSILLEELGLYKNLLETTSINQGVAERILEESKRAYIELEEKTIFDAQSRLIAAINKQIGQEAWSNFVPNFKSLASVNAIFNSKTSIKKRVLFEQATIERMSATPESAANSGMRSIDNIEYRAFIKKFNDKYTDLLQEQKDLLNRFITGFADDGLELRLYLNEELSRLKKAVDDVAIENTEPLISTKLSEVKEYLEGFRKREFTDIDLNKVLKTQELIRELSAND